MTRRANSEKASSQKASTEKPSTPPGGGRRSKICGLGAYLPDRIIRNEDLKQWMETSDEWITKRTGIRQRRWVVAGQSTSDLALEASLAAIEASPVQKREIDCIIVATATPDHVFPGVGCFLQDKLGLPGIPAYDIRQQCSGFVYGLEMADLFIRSLKYRHILLVGADVHSTGLDLSTKGRDIAVLFGDGAGAAIVSSVEVKDPEKESHVFSTHLHADGSFAKDLWMAAPGSAMGEKWITKEMIDAGAHFPQMNGKRVFVSAVKRMSEAVIEAVQANSFSVQDVDLFLFHQANLRISESVGEMLKIPEEKIFNTIQRYGNTTSATLPLGLHDAYTKGVLKPGMLVALSAFGSGFTWGSALLRF